jgi:hypothetical protein
MNFEINDFLDILDPASDDPGAVRTAAPTGQGTSGTSAGLTGAVVSPETVTYAGSGLVFVNSYGSGVTTTFRNEVVAAENYFQSHFTNACTINCSFDLQALNHAFSGENSFSPITVSYSSLVNALRSHATTLDDLAAVASLSHLSDPSGGVGFEVPIGEARILGLAGAGSGIDDAVVLNNFYWTASALQNSPNDAIAVIEHEISEGALGRIGSLGTDGPWAPMDLFRFTASGQRDLTGGRDGLATYFSTDGSSVATGLQYHNSISSSGANDGFDLSDWDQVGSDANAHDPFGPGGPGVGDPGMLSATDLRIMDVLGWTPKAMQQNQVPVVTASNQSATVGQVFNGASLFAASDPDGDALTQYAFQQMTTDPNSGHFVVNGVAVAPNTCVYLTPAQLAATTFVAGSVSADIFVDASDGTAWGTPAEFRIAPPANSIANPTPPVVTASNVSATVGQVLNGPALFSASDSDGDQLTMYAFQQMSTNPNSGHFSVNGVAVTPNTCIYLTPAQLAQTTFVAGSVSADIFVDAFDGTAWGTPAEFHVNPTVNSLPVVTASNVSAIAGQVLSGSSLFSASDSDGDQLTMYAFQQMTTSPNSGHFSVNGVAVAANTCIYLTPAQLAQTTFVAGSASADIFVDAYDGTAWGTPAEFHVNPNSAAAAGSDNGNFTISANTVLELSAASSAEISFVPAGEGMLKLDDSSHFTGDIFGFGNWDSIDLSDIVFEKDTTIGYSKNAENTGGSLLVSDGLRTADLALFCSYIAEAFATSPDGHGGTLVSDSPLSAPTTAPLLTRTA